MTPRCLLPIIIVAIAVTTSSCADNPKQTSTPTPNESMAQLRAKPNNTESPTDTSKAISGKTVNVTLYTSDAQCQELVPQKANVSATEPLTSAVGKIIAAQDTADFNLSGYRVRVNNGIATIDLRLSPQSKRQFTSLSGCEQFALFSSIRKTLTSNSQWQIKEVRFTEKGQEIVL